ncbi:hypothetical protein [Streptomyces xanthophaeus]
MGGAAAEVASATVRHLKELAQERPGEVELLEGFTEAEMDGWTVAVPEEVRIVLREIGGVESDDHAYSFGPRGRERFDDGHWTLGEVDFGEGSLIVGVAAAGWGPVVAVSPWGGDPEVTVQAPEFVGWLAGFAARLADGGADLPPAGSGGVAKAMAAATPSVEVAEGTDAALAALVGRGNPLTDLVDLHALPGYPCTVDWAPYFSTSHNTADTGSSEVQFEIVGEGRALLLHSMAIGDFLGRPVRRHRVPADAGQRAVAELRDLAVEFPGYLALQAGCADSVMDGWGLPVPEEVRGVVREIGGVTVPGLPALRLLPGAPEHAVDPETHRMLGGDGTYWPLARVEYGRSSALAQVRIDPASGRWGYAVSVPTDPKGLREHPEVTLLAESLADLLLSFARRARRATQRPDFAGRVPDAGGWLFPNTGRPWPRPTPVAEWGGSSDPLLAAATALPPGTHAADLREVPIPSDLCFYRARDWPYGARLDHLHFAEGGRLAAAVPTSR